MFLLQGPCCGDVWWPFEAWPNLWLSLWTNLLWHGPHSVLRLCVANVSTYRGIGQRADVPSFLVWCGPSQIDPILRGIVWPNLVWPSLPRPKLVWPGSNLPTCRFYFLRNRTQLLAQQHPGHWPHSGHSLNTCPSLKRKLGKESWRDHFAR